MKLNKSRVLVILLASVMLLTGIGAIFIGWRLSQDDSLLPEPGEAECTPGTENCECATGDSCNDSLVCDYGICRPCGRFTGNPSACWSHDKCEYVNNVCQPRGSTPPPGGGPSCVERGIISDSTMCTIGCGGTVAETDPHNCTNTGGISCSVNGVVGCAYFDPNNPSCGTCQGTGGGSNWNGLCYTGPEGTTGRVDIHTGDSNDNTCPISNYTKSVTLNPGECYTLGSTKAGCEQADPDGGEGQCVDTGCDDTPPPPPPGDKAECLETCTTDSECGTGLKCATVGSGKVCIDADLTDGDQCFDLACETLTSSKTTASVGDTTTLNVTWDVPTSYTTDWSKLLYQSATGYSTIKQCNGLTDCQENWTVPAFTNTPNNAFNFSSQLSFKAFGYNTSLVCQQDGKIVAQVSGNPQVGECDNDCTATLRPLGVSSVLPECTSLAFVKTVSTDTEYPIPGTFQGVGKNGDSSNLVTRYEIGLGATELTGTVNASALANINISESYTVNAATTAVLTFLTASGTEYSSAACRITIDGTTPTTPPTTPPDGEIPETGVVEDSIVVITLAVVLSYLTFFLYKNKVGSAMIIASLSSFVARKDKMENNIHTSVNTRKRKIGEKLIKPKDRKKKFEKDAVDKFEK